MGSRFLNIVRCAVCAIGLVAVQQCWATPIALQVSGQSLDVGGIFGMVGSPINLRFTVQYNTEQTDYDSWNGFGWYQPISYVGLSIKNSEGDDWIAESVKGDSLMIVSVSSYYAKVHEFYASGMVTRADRTPRGDSIIEINLGLRDESLGSLINEMLPVSIDGLNRMQRAYIAIIDGSHSAPNGGIFFLTDWTAAATDVVVGAAPEPPTLSLILGALAGIGAFRHRLCKPCRVHRAPSAAVVNVRLRGFCTIRPNKSLHRTRAQRRCDDSGLPGAGR
jgi:hypothetical protein